MYDAVILQMVNELLESQDRSYRSTFKLLLTDRKEDVKSLEKDIDELKKLEVLSLRHKGLAR